MTYWDTSALIKLYVVEPDSTYFRNLASQSKQPIFTSDIAKEEMLSALYRKEYEGNLNPNGAIVLFTKFEEDIKQGPIITIPKGSDILSMAKKVLPKIYADKETRFLRSLDLIHLASALSLKAKTMVVTDRRLRQVAALTNIILEPKQSPK